MTYGFREPLSLYHRDWNRKNYDENNVRKLGINADKWEKIPVVYDNPLKIFDENEKENIGKVFIRERLTPLKWYGKFIKNILKQAKELSEKERYDYVFKTYVEKEVERVNPSHTIEIDGETYFFKLKQNNWIYFYVQKNPVKNKLNNGNHFTIGYSNEIEKGLDKGEYVQIHFTSYSNKTRYTSYCNFMKQEYVDNKKQIACYNIDYQKIKETYLDAMLDTNKTINDKNNVMELIKKVFDIGFGVNRTELLNAQILADKVKYDAALNRIASLRRPPLQERIPLQDITKKLTAKEREKAKKTPRTFFEKTDEMTSEGYDIYKGVQNGKFYFINNDINGKKVYLNQKKTYSLQASSKNSRSKSRSKSSLGNNNSSKENHPLK